MNTATSNYDYHDYDYYVDDSDVQYSWLTCQDYCKEDPQCTFFALDEELHYCYNYSVTFDTSLLKGVAEYVTGLRNCALGKLLANFDVKYLKKQK